MRSQRGAPTFDTRTGPDGRFTLRLTPETHTLHFSHPDHVAPAEIFLDWQDGAFVVRNVRHDEQSAKSREFH